MLIKSWQVNEQVPALINVSDLPDELTATQNTHLHFLLEHISVCATALGVKPPTLT